MKQKTCKVCPNTFTPWSSTQVVCSPDCAKTKAEQDRIKKETKEATRKRKEYRDEKEKQKTRADWMREAQKVVNLYIRKRDKGKPCISCGCPWDETFQAGHFMATSIRPAIRLDPRNIYGQCVRDNMHLHGNLLGFRKGIIEREGVEMVEWLEGDHPPAKFSIQDLQDIIREYKEKTKRLQSNERTIKIAVLRLDNLTTDSAEYRESLCRYQKSESFEVVSHPAELLDSY